MRAIILAAGAGTRLRPLTRLRPKCLVPVGGRPLLDYQLEALAGAGITDVVVVVGYEYQQVMAHCGSTVRYLHNPDYARTNSIYSLYLAAGEMDTELVLLNCDILFHPRILDRLLSEPAPAALAVDASVPLVTGEMNVSYGTDRRIRCISKSLEASRAQALSVQLVRFDARSARQVRDEVARLVSGSRRDVFPTSAYGPLIRARALAAVEVTDLPWGEVDSLEDLERVKREVVPRVAGDGSAADPGETVLKDPGVTLPEQAERR